MTSIPSRTCSCSASLHHPRLTPRCCREWLSTKQVGWALKQWNIWNVYQSFKKLWLPTTHRKSYSFPCDWGNQHWNYRVYQGELNHTLKWWELDSPGLCKRKLWRFDWSFQLLLLGKIHHVLSRSMRVVEFLTQLVGDLTINTFI